VDVALTSLAAAYPGATIVGCSTAGEIAGGVVQDDSLVATIIAFESATVRSATAIVRGPEDSFSAGSAIASQLHQPGLRAVLVLSDGLHVNGSELVRGINAVLPPEAIVTGGLAADGDRFAHTWVALGTRREEGLVVGIGLFGERLRVGHGSRGGWDIFGPERLVTRSEGNVLYSLDGRPALELYREYLGELASGLPATALLFPLALRESRTGEALVRTVLSVDDATQSLRFAGDIPRGWNAQLMRANFDRLIDGASLAAAAAYRPAAESNGMLSLAISCVGRRLILGERTDEELEAALEALPAGVVQVGFYSYGELSPVAAGRCDLHNQTMTITTLSEDR
jgi:hypothetical protein